MLTLKYMIFLGFSASSIMLLTKCILQMNLLKIDREYDSILSLYHYFIGSNINTLYSFQGSESEFVLITLKKIKKSSSYVELIGLVTYVSRV